MSPFVDKQKCTGCGICIEFCPAEAIIKKDGKAFISIECVECGACIAECPEEAIVLEED
jgi:Pyruvate/2-oxoacid:ferredoxin oxidoreductase delta subunit